MDSTTVPITNNTDMAAHIATIMADITARDLPTMASIYTSESVVIIGLDRLADLAAWATSFNTEVTIVTSTSTFEVKMVCSIAGIETQVIARISGYSPDAAIITTLLGRPVVIPRTHVPHALADADVSADTMRRACQLAASMGLKQLNLITSVGRWSTQTVGHLHIHLGPRRQGDGLPLLWTPQQAAARLGDIPDDVRIAIASFGFLHGTGPAADMVMDLRPRLRDPHTDPALRELTGHDRAIRDKVASTPGYLDVLRALAESALALAGAGQQRVVVAVGCAGGRHRSVVLAEDLTALLRLRTTHRVAVRHLDIAQPVIQRPAVTR